MMKQFSKLMIEDRGVVTADWLALVCGVTILAVVATSAIEDKLAIIPGIDAGITVARK